MSQGYKPDPLAAAEFHRIPAAMRKVMHTLMTAGTAKDHADAEQQTHALFQQWASGKDSAGTPLPPVTQEAAGKVLTSYHKRKAAYKTGGKGKYTKNIRHGDQAGGDTGYSYNQMHFSHVRDL